MIQEPVAVFGATGSFGGAVLAELQQRGIRMRALVRNTEKARARFPDADKADWLQGDVHDLEAVRRATENARIIIHGINYPYDQWVPNMEKATETILQAARETGALIVFPGNVYGLGNQTGTLLSEETPNRPCTRKGSLRVRLEEMLRAATGNGTVRALVLRAGDYFGPTVRNGLVDPIFGNASHGKTIQVLGRTEIAHQWAFVPDLARATVDLLDRSDRLAAFEVVHFKGHIADPQADLLRLIAQEAGHPNLAIRTTPWWILRIVGLFNGVVREVMEMRYLLDESVLIDDVKLRRLLPEYRDTPLNEAIRRTLSSYR